MCILLSRMGLLLALTLLLASPSHAGPPDEGYVGAIVYRNGTEPDRIACDQLELVKSIYDAGTVGTYREVRVLEAPVLLGPVENPVGDAKLYLWAIHVDNSPKGGDADYWILYLDTKTARPWLQVGKSI